MTTSIKIRVNGRYKATVKQDDKDSVEVHGNYDGSPNPSGEHSFNMPHPANTTIVVTEEQVPEDAGATATDEAKSE
jgi:hypothetical protein